jgi:hypothetical protein
MDKTAAILVLTVILTLFFMGTASAATHATATPTVSIAPTPNATATPVPTPEPRQVFFSPKWDTDHVTITVNNNGGPIQVVAWIDNPSKKATISVVGNETLIISTPSIAVQNGQIVKFGFEAVENVTVIDSYSATITVSTGPTPTALPPESVTLSGTIIDADNSTPISGVTITFHSLTYDKTYAPVTTAADGTYTSPKMYPDSYSIKITANGYQASTRATDKVAVDSTLDTIGIKRIAGTPTPIATPTSPIDSWISLLYNPALCVGTISSLIAVIVGSIGIYEWMERKRKDRLAQAGKGGDKKDEPPIGIKKP